MNPLLPALASVVLFSAGTSGLLAQATPPAAPVAVSLLQSKAERLIIPRLEFSEADISDCLDLARRKGLELDADKAGVNIVLHTGAKKPGAVTMSLRNVALWDALKVIAEVAGLSVTVVPGAILLHGSDTKPAATRKAQGLEQTKDWKLASEIVVDRMSFAEADPADVAEYLRRKSQEMGKPINLNIAPKVAGTITLDLRNIKLSDTLEIIAELTGTELAAAGETILLRLVAPAPKAEPAKKSLVQEKAEAIFIPNIDMQDVDVADCLDHLRSQSSICDKSPPGMRGLGFINRLGNTPKISISMKNTSVWDLARQIAAAVGAEVVVKDHKITLQPDGTKE